MPIYLYRCPANDRVVEVRHGMSASLATWGEVCAQAELEPGDTPADAPVERALTAPTIAASAAPTGSAPGVCPCGQFGGCGAG